MEVLQRTNPIPIELELLYCLQIGQFQMYTVSQFNIFCHVDQRV